MSAVALPTGAGGLAVFEPQRTLDQQAKAGAIIDYARRVRDWPLLERAVDEKIEQQVEFVRWWGEVVSVRHGLNRHTIEISDQKSLDADEAERLTGITPLQVHKWRRATKPAALEKYRAALFGAAYKKAMAGTSTSSSGAHVAANSGENEWYTPTHLIEAARLAMGGIDLDPASSATANRTVLAESFYTQADDGLAQDWHGRVWLNPPYAQPLIARFAEAVASKFEAKQIEQACILVNNATETAWFHRMLAVSDAVCFPRGRVRFLDPQGNPGAPLQGQALLYLGARRKQFAKAFAQEGTVLTHG